jgi:hypothetical protein
MSKRERRARHGELITEAWNPNWETASAGHITINGQPIELRRMSMTAHEHLTIARHVNDPSRFRVYSLGELRIIASIDVTEHGRLMHISVSRSDCYATWDEMIAIKRHFYPPDVAAVMVAPEEEVYVNIQSWTLHWWQLPVKWGLM